MVTKNFEKNIVLYLTHISMQKLCSKDFDLIFFSFFFRNHRILIKYKMIKFKM